MRHILILTLLLGFVTIVLAISCAKPNFVAPPYAPPGGIPEGNCIVYEGYVEEVDGIMCPEGNWIAKGLAKFSMTHQVIRCVQLIVDCPGIEE
jgi:hypothetical protein